MSQRPLSGTDRQMPISDGSVAMTHADGVYFDDLHRGQTFKGPSITLDCGTAAAHRAVLGDRLELALDHRLSEAVMGGTFAHPALVWDTAIGQSTAVTQNVVANLFYRGLMFHRFPHIGDTLTTTTIVEALRENKRRPDRPHTGLAALRVTTTDHDSRKVLDFYRCAMLPIRDQSRSTNHADDLDAVGADQTDGLVAIDGWNLDVLRTGLRLKSSIQLSPGESLEVRGGDVVTNAPELARLTLNLARVHHDNRRNPTGRLVYGGHTIGVALHQVCRAIPSIFTVTGWTSCDHTGPVREGDTLVSRIEIQSVRQHVPGISIVALRSHVFVAGEAPRPVLDWRFEALAATA